MLATWLTRVCVTLALIASVPALGRVPAAGQGFAPKVVNLNSAPQAELETLPGVNAALAKKIIASRPYATVAELSKAGVPPATIKKIEPRATVAPPRLNLATTSTVVRIPGVKGHVWVNTATKMYHKEGDRYYGKTPEGKFMPESEAIKAGYHEAKTAK